MSRLTPELKRLMAWARQAPEPPPLSPPLGFAARVSARWSSAPGGSMFAIWQRAVWGSAGAAAVVIIVGLLALTAQKLRTTSPYDFTPAYQVVATDVVP